MSQDDLNVSETPAPEALEEEEVLVEEDLSTEEEGEDGEAVPATPVIFKYPYTMNPETFPGVIRFEAFKVEGVNLAEKALQFIEWLAKKPDNQQVANQDSETPNETTDQTETVTDEEYASIAEQLTSLQGFELPIGESQGGVVLYLPAGVQFNDAVNYTQANLGIIGGGLEGLLGKGSAGGVTNNDGSLAEGASNIIGAKVARATPAGISTILGKIVGKKLANSGVGGAALGFVAGASLGQGVEDAVKSVTRTTTNPNVRTLFESVVPRAFSYQFKMVAKSQDEAEEIKRIIKFFRKEIYPETIRLGNDQSIPFGYVFPNIFRISIEHRSKQVASKILPAYLRSVGTSYNQTGMGFHSDGNFVDVDITLDFIESTTMDKQKVDQGF